MSLTYAVCFHTHFYHKEQCKINELYTQKAGKDWYVVEIQQMILLWFLSAQIPT